ncbi:hypothetical protein AB0J71_31755 [Nonomuraea sp. NPDC049637]|uniref:hypothetical protein n=1 Tax=Nonomuraea sp. NPDC049637 TaxID=3154356 RepID=UPI003434773F
MEEIEQLQKQLHTLTQNNAKLHEDVVMWRRLAAKRSGFDDLPSLDDDYLHALLSPQHEHRREVQVLVDGRPAVACFSRNRRRNPDAAYMLDHWRQFVGTVRAIREVHTEAGA